MSLEKISSNKSFGGDQLRFTHASKACKCDMTFAIYLPPAAEHGPVPVVYWLSGLTCTDENFVTKAGAQAFRRRSRALQSSRRTRARAARAFPTIPDACLRFRPRRPGSTSTRHEAPWADALSHV